MLKAILVDDDSSNLNTLSELIKQYEKRVETVGLCNTIDQAAVQILKHKPDVVFLDVEMQNETGFDLFKLFSEPEFNVIFTTAHEKYALQAIRSSCLDYLLKPIDYRELNTAIDKLSALKNMLPVGRQIESLLSNTKIKRLEKMAVPGPDGYSFFDIDDLIFCEADANYTKLFLQSGEVLLSSRNLKEFDEMLSDSDFFRSHKSFLINLKKIKKFSRTEGNQILMSNNLWVDLSFRKRDEFLKLFVR